MKTSELREKFLSFFESHGHTRVDSSPLVLKDDPTLLFVNAGMVPFKNCFLGTEDRGFKRATSCQKSLRISGKHNDLENVGRTARHHTFFEMLGNFSFGDYFKENAIDFAWKFLTEELKLDTERLWITVYEDDDEAEELWKKVAGVPASRILRCGAKDNFWAMGETGPCGPCSEIHYFLRDDLENQCEEDFRKDDGSYLEIWNLVFMQFEREVSGETKNLPSPSVDTGMGLERIASVVQGVKSNYDADEFREIISRTEALVGEKYIGEDYSERDPLSDTSYEKDIAFRVLGDHARAACFLILDGVRPGSDGRSYVLRRLIRRASRHARALGREVPTLCEVAGYVCQVMGGFYGDLKVKEAEIVSTIKREEERFLETLVTGLSHLDQEIAKTKDAKLELLSGQAAFTLHDTYGFPLDLTADIAGRHGLKVDEKKFDSLMAEQKERSRSARASEDNLVLQKTVKPHPTKFIGYTNLEAKASIQGIFAESGELESASEGDNLALVFSETPFYGESGGQLGDSGLISGAGFQFEVSDTKKVSGDTFAHIGRVTSGTLKKGDEASLRVNEERRKSISLNHSATHLLHLALQKTLGEHVKQAGSRVSESELRFDFSHDKPVSQEELEQISEIVNSEIRANHPVKTEEMAIENAKAKGATALFGEKYGDEVRVVQIGEDSLELCGGTHAERSGDINVFILQAESGVAAGVRRIEALSGASAVNKLLELQRVSQSLASELSVPVSAAPKRLKELMASLKEQEQELASYKQKENASLGGDLVGKAEELSSGVKVLAEKTTVVDPKLLREVADDLRNRLGSGCIALAGCKGDKVIVLTAVTKDLTGEFHAGNLVKEIAGIMGSKGGGRPDLAQAGGGDVSKIDEALAHFKHLVGKSSG